MEIEESQIFLEEGFVNEEKALAWLLYNGYCFLNSVDISYTYKSSRGEEWPSRWTTCIYVNANDIFMWGCADSECIENNDGQEPSEIISLYKACKENKDWGYIKWLSTKRRLQPQYPIKRDMIKNGYWPKELDSLPLNPSDPKFKEKI